MRQAKPRSKIKTRLSIPKTLRDFLGEVLKQIEAGAAVASIESDDLLQSEVCFGGLIDAVRELFAFTFFPDLARSQKWHFEASVAEIRAILANPNSVLTLWACQSANCGSAFPRTDELCLRCDWVDDTPIGTQQGPYATRREWALAYFAHNPSAHPLAMIGAFNSESTLGVELGRFSLAEATALKNQSDGKA